MAGRLQSGYHQIKNPGFRLTFMLSTAEDRMTEISNNFRTRSTVRFGTSLKMLNDGAQHVFDRKLIRNDIGSAAELLDGCGRNWPDASDRASAGNLAKLSTAEKPDKIPHRARACEGNDIDFALDEQVRQWVDIKARQLGPIGHDHINHRAPFSQGSGQNFPCFGRSGNQHSFAADFFR
jgi:hypothetical protein